MAKILYKRTVENTEELEFEVEDIKNVFLKGQDKIYNRTVCFGLWQYKAGFKVVTISSDVITFDHSICSSENTSIDIKKFLQSHNSVEKISQQQFISRLSNVKWIFES